MTISLADRLRGRNPLYICLFDQSEIQGLAAATQLKCNTNLKLHIIRWRSDASHLIYSACLALRPSQNPPTPHPRHDKLALPLSWEHEGSHTTMTSPWGGFEVMLRTVRITAGKPDEFVAQSL